MIKKHIKTGALLLSLILVLASCTSRKEAVTIKTQEFLDAYFRMDYLAASKLCTKELGEELITSLNSLDSLEPSVKAMLEKQAAGVKTEIVSTELKKGTDSAKVVYKVILPNFTEGIENKLSLIKIEKSWFVSGLGK